MKEAKQHGSKHRCGNCARTIKLRHDSGKLACTAHLTVVSVDHAAECNDYESAAELALPATATATPAPSAENTQVS